MLSPKEQQCMMHQHYNQIRRVILNPKNNHKHLPSIGNLIRAFEFKFGICKLSMRLQELKTIVIKFN